MITIHQEKETDFTKNGYGTLDDYIINPEISWEMNGEFVLNFDYPVFARYSKFLTDENIVRAPVPYMDDQLFRVYRPIPRLGYIQVTAKHIFYDLNDNFVEDTNVVGKNGLGALNQILNATQYPHRFNAFSDIDTVGNARIVRYNPVEALLDDSKDNTFINRWGGEVYRDNFNIHMRKRLGSNRGVRIEHKKDLTGFESEMDFSTVITRIMPKGFDGLLLPEKYVDSPLLDPDRPKIRVVEYSEVKAAVGDYADDEDALPLNEAYAELRRLAKEEYSIHHVDEPETVIHVDFVTLENTKEYEDFKELQTIHQGDTVRVLVPEQDIEINSRLVAFKSNPLFKNHYTSTTLGNHVLEYTTSRTEIDVIRKEIKNTNELITITRQAANGKNSNFWGTADPNTLELNAQIDDTYFQEDGDYFAIWEYVEVNGERYWRKGPNTDFGKEISNQLKEAVEDIAEAKQTAGEAVEQINTAVASLGFIDLPSALSSFDGQLVTHQETLDGMQTIVYDPERGVASLNTQLADLVQIAVTGDELTGAVSILNDNINLRVSKGELLSQINIEAGRTLIQSDKLLLDANNTVITGTAWMDGAVIANASIDGAKIQDATIGSAKIASLDVSKISGNKSTFLESMWNEAYSNVRVNGQGVWVNNLSGTRVAHLNMQGVDLTSNGLDRVGVTVRTANRVIGRIQYLPAQTGYLAQGAMALVAHADYRVALGRYIGGADDLYDYSLEINAYTGEVVISKDTNFYADVNMNEYSIDNVANIDTNRVYTRNVNIGTQGLIQASGNALNVSALSGNLGFMAGGSSVPQAYLSTSIFETTVNVKVPTLTANNVTATNQVETPMVQTNRLNIGTNGYIQPISSALSITASRGNLAFAAGGSTSAQMYLATNIFESMVNVKVPTITAINVYTTNFYETSDRRLKRDIKNTLSESLEINSQLHFVDFNWKKDELNSGTGRRLGLIAQETPALATYDSVTDTWSIDRGKLLMVTAHGLQQLELREKNTNKVASQALQATETNAQKIERLEKRIEELEGAA